MVHHLTGSWSTCSYLQLQVLAPVIPLKQDAALSFALVEALQRRLVLLHLLHHLGAQVHHRLVVTDGEDQHVVRRQTAFSHGQVTLQPTHGHLLSARLLPFCFTSIYTCFLQTHVCSDADDEVFLHLRTGQTEPARTGGLSCTRDKT